MTPLEDMVHITDILPTLARLAGVQETFHTDGYDIWDAVRGVAPFERDTVVYNLDIDDQSPNFQFAIRVNKWKLFWGQRGKFVVRLSIKYIFFNTQNIFVSGARAARARVSAVQPGAGPGRGGGRVGAAPGEGGGAA